MRRRPWRHLSATESGLPTASGLNDEHEGRGPLSDSGAPVAVGAALDEVATPALLVDLDLFDANARTMAAVLSEAGLDWRPHAKGHKSPVLAARQLDLGAIGVTCATLAEAATFAAAGIPRILVANELGSPASWSRVARLQDRAEVIVCVDDPEHLEHAESGVPDGARVPVLIEVDVGVGRAGVRDLAAALRLAEALDDSDRLRLGGVMGYEGQVTAMAPGPDKETSYEASLDVLVEIVAGLEGAGHQVDIVSGGGTGTLMQAGRVGRITESQAGGGCLMDRYYRERCGVDLAQALTVVATVVSAPTAELVVIDAGFKAIGKLPGMPLPVTADVPGLYVVDLHAEHGLLRRSSDAPRLRVGDRVTLVPGYSDAAIVLHDRLVAHRDGEVVEIIPVSARGRIDTA